MTARYVWVEGDKVESMEYYPEVIDSSEKAAVDNVWQEWVEQMESCVRWG